MDLGEFRRWCQYIQTAQTERALLTQYMTLVALPASEAHTELLTFWAERWNALTNDQVTLDDLRSTTRQPGQTAESLGKNDL